MGRMIDTVKGDSRPELTIVPDPNLSAVKDAFTGKGAVFANGNIAADEYAFLDDTTAVQDRASKVDV